MDGRRLSLFFALLCVCPVFAQQDGDRDGIDDGLEQQLLEKFLPRFLISASECDQLPAAFAPDADEPKVIARDGVIYGQASPHSAGGIELRYFHLWSRDCGRAGHTFDIEHVSALVRSARHDAPPAEWKALFWYAAAHEGTPCDASSGAAASSLRAEEYGPPVWISGGKHASFLDLEKCGSGCGADACIYPKPLRVAKLINLGEPEAPLNGALWVQSRRWGLRAKMSSDFDAATIRQISDGRDLHAHLRPTKAVFLAGGSTLDALAVGQRSTEDGLSVAAASTGSSLGTSAKKVHRSLLRSAKTVGRALRHVTGERTQQR